ncbi:MAG: hypothetical protein WCF52_16690, partial [Pseudolabrys sp.]
IQVMTNEAFARVKIDQLLRDTDWHLTDGLSVGEFNRSSQHPEIGGCDDGLQTCLGSMHKKEVACARAPACLAA